MIKNSNVEDFSFDLLVAGIGVEFENKQQEKAMRASKQRRHR